MKVEVYSLDNNEVIDTLELPASEISDFVALVKAYSFEDGDGEERKFNDAKVCEGGFVVYVVK